MSENRREYFRVIFHQSINGEVAMHGDTHFVPVEIENVSVRGLKFISSMDIGINNKVTCSFKIMDGSFLLDGSIIRKSRRTHDIEYGVGFDVDQDTSSQLFKQLNYYQIRQRKGNPMEMD